jgi:hypothetical protein
MRNKIGEEVSVVMYYSAKHRRVIPHHLVWHGRDYFLGKIGYYHSYMDGRERQHIFELTDREESLWFRLRLDSKNLHWILEATHDGEPG